MNIRAFLCCSRLIPTRLFLGVLFLAATAVVSNARTLTFTGNADFYNLWSEPDNWSPSGPPVNGDTLVFPAGFSPYNDLSSLEVHSIQFTGNGSTYLSGNPISVESDITAANNNGEARVSFDITFTGVGGTFYTLGSSILNIEDNVVFTFPNAALNLYAFTTNILVQGSIQGSTDVVKLGSGDAYLEGTLANTYTGGTYVREGKLHLSKSANVVAISPRLSVGESTTKPCSMVDDNPGEYPLVMNVTIGPYGNWILNGQTTVTNLEITNSSSLGGAYPGASIHGSGILTLNCDVHVAGTNISEIFCTLYMGSQTRTFTIDGGDWANGYTKVGSIVGTGSAGITKLGRGALVLGSPNDYSGPTLVEHGLLAVNSNTGLGATSGLNSGTTVYDNGSLEFNGVTVSEPITCEDGSSILYARTNTLTGSITLDGDCSFGGWSYGYFNNDLLQLNNVISGIGGMNIGGGTVRLGGTSPNTFTGGAVVGEDFRGSGFACTLELAKPNDVVAVPGQVDVNNFFSPSTSPTVLRNFQNNGVQSVRIGHAGQWLLNGHVAAPQSLTFYNDGLVDSQGGQLQMNSGAGTNRFYVSAASYSSFTAQIAGIVSLNAPMDEFFVDSGPALQVSALITGAGSLVKTGPGTMTIAGTDFNDFAGEAYVNQGTLQLNKPLASTAIPGPVEVGTADGSSAGVLRNLNSYQIVGNIYVHSQGLYDINGQVENTDYLTLDGNATVQTGAGYLSIKTGAGITVNPGVNTTATINDHVYLDPGNHIVTVGSGATSPGVKDFVINASIGETSGTASLQKEGPGKMKLTGDNSYTGTTFVNGGIVFPASANALGATNGFTIVNNGGALVLDGGVSIGGEPLYLNNTLPVPLQSWSGSNVWLGNINLTGDSRIAVSNILNAYNFFNGPGNLIKVGAGTLVLDGLSPNTYAGDTFVNEGTLATRKVQLGTISIPHNVTIGTGLGGPPAKLLNQNENNIAGRVTINDGAIWDLQGWGVAFQNAALLGGPAVTLNGAASVTSGIIDAFDDCQIVVNAGNNTTAVIDAQIGFVYPDTLSVIVSSGNNQAGKPECILNGNISQFIPPGNLLKDGAGTLRLTGTNTITGTNFVNAGTLWVDGVQPQSAVLLVGGTLGGYGTVGSIFMTGSSGVLSPGETTGMLTCSNFNSGNAGGIFRAELNGPAPGTSYDQLNARGTVSLNGLSLKASLNYNTSAAGDQFTIINNDGSDAVTGTFTGLPEGKKLYVGQELFQISYAGGTGNDVVLSRVTTPPPPVLSIERASSNMVRLLWATNDPPFSLQTCSNLLSNDWSAASPAPIVVGATNVVTNSVVSPAQFYRLAVP